MKIQKLKMPTQTLEPIGSSLLYTKPDGSQDFIHDSYRDYFLARSFLNRLKKGKQSLNHLIREVFTQFNRPKKALRTTFLFFVGSLPSDRVKEFIGIVSGDREFTSFAYELSFEDMRSLATNMVMCDLDLADSLFGFIDLMFSKNNLDALSNFSKYNFAGLYPYGMSKGNSVNSSAFQVEATKLFLEAGGKIEHVLNYARRGWASAIYLLGILGHYDNCILEHTTFRNCPLSVMVGLEALQRLNHFDETILRMMGYSVGGVYDYDDDHDWSEDARYVRFKAMEVAIYFGKYKEVVDQLESDTKSLFDVASLSYLANILSKESAKKLLFELERRGIEKFESEGVKKLYEKVSGTRPN